MVSLSTFLLNNKLLHKEILFRHFVSLVGIEHGTDLTVAFVYNIIKKNMQWAIVEDKDLNIAKLSEDCRQRR